MVALDLAGQVLLTAVYKGNLRTGEGGILVAGSGDPAAGLSFDERTGYLYVAGGAQGSARVYDSEDGTLVRSFQFTGQTTFVNDVVVTRSAAFFTDSFQGVLYRVPLSPNGDLPATADFDSVMLGGNYVMSEGFNLNGIESAADGEALITVQTNLGILYTVDPQSGIATQIDLGGASLPGGDGILLSGNTLYVVQNTLNQIAVIELSPDLASGNLTGTITDPGFDTPSSVAEFGNSLYAVNARFGVPPAPDTEYDIAKVSKR